MPARQRAGSTATGIEHVEDPLRVNLGYADRVDDVCGPAVHSGRALRR
jgi:hypothetical protein